MIAIRLRFPASRYHANAWGRHVNEGVAEWPPSPYRLLRALYDTWKRKCAHLDEALVESVLRALSSEAPRFALPTAVASHTRSYLSGNSEDTTAKNLIFDAFLKFNPDAECHLIWPEATLSAEQRGTASELLGNLNYLGRSESWVMADLDDAPEYAPNRCEPVDATGQSGEVVPVACVVRRGEYRGKRRWLDALTTSTTEMIKEHQSAPPLLNVIRYTRPESCIETDPVRAPLRRAPHAAAVLLALDSTVLPMMTATLEIAEQIRVRLMGAHRRRMGGDPGKVSPLFSGKTASGEKRLDHGHVFVLPLGNAGFRIDRVLLLSRLRPFTQDELDAVRGVQSLWQADDRPKVRCVVAWQGALEDRSIRQPAREVVSGTPFVTVRHLRRGRTMQQFLEDEIRRECRNHGMGQPSTVMQIARPPGAFECIEYRRNRKDDPPRPGYAFRLTFDEPVPAPFSLGYGSHFGLGQFRAANPSSA